MEDYVTQINESQIIKYLTYLNGNEKIDSLEILRINQLDNKMWKCFLDNDGSMTKMLRNLFGNGFNIKLLSQKEVDAKSLLLSNLSSLENVSNETFGNSFLERRIQFLDNESVIMDGISFWDVDKYKEIFPTEEEQKKPIGLVLIEKQVEFFKEIFNYILKDEDKKLIFRISVFKKQKQFCFLLLEIFDSDSLKKFFGNLE